MEPQTQQEIHGHLNKLVILIFFLLVIGTILTWLGYNFMNNKMYVENTENSTVTNNKENAIKPLTINPSDSPSLKKSLIIDRVQSANKVPLSKDERNTILKELDPKNISQYKISPNEKSAILYALNRQ